MFPRTNWEDKTVWQDSIQRYWEDTIVWQDSIQWHLTLKKTPSPLGTP